MCEHMCLNVVILCVYYLATTEEMLEAMDRFLYFTNSDLVVQLFHLLQR